MQRQLKLVAICLANAGAHTLYNARTLPEGQEERGRTDAGRPSPFTANVTLNPISRAREWRASFQPTVFHAPNHDCVFLLRSVLKVKITRNDSRWDLENLFSYKCFSSYKHLIKSQAFPAEKISLDGTNFSDCNFTE